MTFPIRRLIPCLWFLALAQCVACAQSIHIGNADTGLQLTAGKNAPQMQRLTETGGGAWEGQSPERLIDHVTVRGRRADLRWRYNPAASVHNPALVRLTYDADSPHLRLIWEWRARAAHGPLEHTIRITNLSNSELWLPLQDSLQFSWRVAADEPLEQLWVEKGAGKPSAIGTHLVKVGDGHKWIGESSTYAHPAEGQPREIIPYFMVEQPDGKRLGWYTGLEFSGRTRLTLERSGDSVRGVAGLNPTPGLFRTRLLPGETFTTPTVFLGAFRGDPDDAGNILRRWIREVLNDPRTIRDPSYPLLVNNSWGSEMAIGEAQAERMIRESQELGLEMFHLDAGWFRGVGDWYPDPAKFPHGLAAIAEYAHRHGLKFGLWVDWAQAGMDKQPGALNVNDPKTRDWLTTDPPPGWKPAPFKGITIDLGVPAAKAWSFAEVSRITRDYHLDMLEHDGYVVAQGCDRTDHPHAPPGADIKRYTDEEFLWVESSNSTDVSYHATQAYYDIYARLKREHPGLLLEICNDGGRMVDFGSAAHGDYFSITDSYDPLSNRQAFYDSSHVLPPAMLEAYVKKWPTPRLENFRYMLRSGMMGWFTLMLDTTAWSPEQHAAAREEFALYKARLRPLIRQAHLYHVAPRPDGKGWDGTEYVDPDKGQGVLFAFHGSDEEAKSYKFMLQGLRPDRSYRVRFHDHSAPDRTLPGRVLMQQGLEVMLPVQDSSELVFLEQTPD
ncbi:MAG: alpha-galactosidase [Acidobacteriaceae bacterium]